MKTYSLKKPTGRLSTFKLRGHIAEFAEVREFSSYYPFGRSLKAGKSCMALISTKFLNLDNSQPEPYFLIKPHIMDDQQMFERQTGFLWKVAKWLFKALVYFPLIITSFIIVSSIMKKEVSSLLGLAVVILVSFILYLLVYFVKGILICLKSNNKLLWVLPFIICVAFTCILPVYLVLDPVGYLVQSSSRSGNPYNILKWIFSLAFGVYVYFRYDFLTNIAPSIAFPAYQAGINITMSILNRAYRVEAKKSSEPI